MSTADQPLALARAIFSAAAATPGVAAIGSGRPGDIATRGPGESIPGVRITATPDGPIATVSLTAVYRRDGSLIALADEVRRRAMAAAAQTVTGGVRALHVAVRDIRLPAGRTV